LTAAWIVGVLLDLGAGAPTLTPKGADLELLDEIRRIAANVERLREEAFTRPPLAVRVPEELRQAAAEIRAAGALPRNRLEARGRAWSDIGLGGQATPLGLLRELAADLPGVGFDPAGNRLLVAPDRLTSSDFQPPAGDDEADPATILLLTGVRLDEPRIGHVLTHVRQRERRGGDFLLPTTDALLAAAAWAEGEANLVAIRYLFRGMQLEDEILRHRLDPREVLGGSLVPRSLHGADGVERRLLEFVYLEGFARAAEVYRAGGWSALARSMQRATTTLELADPRIELDASADPPACGALDGHAPADEDSLGQQAIVVLISLTTGKDNLGILAADGWRGDRLCRWEGPPGSVTAWSTRWADAAAAADFVYAYGRSLGARFPEAARRPTPGGALDLAAAGRRFLLERSGLEVRIRVEPAPADPASRTDADLR